MISFKKLNITQNNTNSCIDLKLTMSYNITESDIIFVIEVVLC